MTVEAARRVLAVGREVDAEDLRTARNKAMMKAHPDHGGSAAALKKVLDAFAVLEVWIAEGSPTVNEELPTLEITVTLAMMGGRQIVRIGSRKLAIALPAGLREGDKLSAGGELFLIRIAHAADRFVSGDDLCMVMKVSNTLLANGGKLKVKTPAGDCMVFIPKQVGTNRIVRVLGRGLPPRGSHRQGALVLKLEPAQAAKPAKPVKRKGWAAA